MLLKIRQVRYCHNHQSKMFNYIHLFFSNTCFAYLESGTTLCLLVIPCQINQRFPGDPSRISWFLDVWFISMRNKNAENLRSFAQLDLKISPFENWQVRQVFRLRWGKWDHTDYWGAVTFFLLNWHILIFGILI